MNEYAAVENSSPKRVKLITNEENVCALNLTVCERNTNMVVDEEYSNAAEEILSMRNKYQQWVLETYRDASKTKTITAKKYERIVKTLCGEIKNCAENSKFRFWMKCKGFKLESNDKQEKVLYVLDKKGEEAKYKKVAIVENFFDIIYNVHVNEGARGIKHAGQKRTHRSITETYAFLPREAVTKFLLCCVDCQKRMNEDRKNSPSVVSSSSSHDSTIYQNSISFTDETTKTSELCTSELILAKPSISLLRNRHLATFNAINSHQNNKYCYENATQQICFTNNANCHETNNNLIISDIKDCTIAPNTKNVSITLNELMTENLTRITDGSMSRLPTRKRKRKFTRKIVRLRNNEVEPCDVTTDFENSAKSCPSSTPYRNQYCGIGEEEKRIKMEPLEENGENTPRRPVQPRTSEHFLRQFPADGVKIPFAENAPLQNVINTNTTKYTTETALRNEKSNYVITDARKCPYIAKVSDILNNPLKYRNAWKERVDDDTVPDDDDFLEQLAIEVIQKAKHLEQIKRKLTELEKEELSTKISNCRVVSFLVNYAADLMLRTLTCEIT